MSLPGRVPPKLLHAWQRRTQEQREALEALVLGTSIDDAEVQALEAERYR